MSYENDVYDDKELLDESINFLRKILSRTNLIMIEKDISHMWNIFSSMIEL